MKSLLTMIIPILRYHYDIPHITSQCWFVSVPFPSFPTVGCPHQRRRPLPASTVFEDPWNVVAGLAALANKNDG